MATVCDSMNLRGQRLMVPSMPKSKAKTRPHTKSIKLQLRLRAEQKVIITRAAKLRQMTLNKFMLEHAYDAAQQVLAHQVHFVLPPKRWQEFSRALDAPPKIIPSLNKLLTGTSVF